MNRDSEIGAAVGFVRSLKGAPASVLLAMALTGRPCTKLELGAATGYTDKPVKRAVEFLVRLGLAQQDGAGRGWSLDERFQRRLFTLLTGDSPKQEDRQVVSALPPVEKGLDPIKHTAGPGRRNSDEDRKNSEADRKNSEVDQKNFEVGRKNSDEDRKNSDEDRKNSELDRKNSEAEDLVVVANIDSEKDEYKQQQQTTARDRNFSEEGAELAALLKRIGVTGRAFKRLSSRPDLVADPVQVLAWWWYYRTQPWSNQPAGAVICRLEDGHEPPESFLSLARIWPGVSAGDRHEIEEKQWRGWNAHELSAYFGELYPGLTTETFSAYMTLSDIAPEELTSEDNDLPIKH